MQLVTELKQRFEDMVFFPASFEGGRHYESAINWPVRLASAILFLAAYLVVLLSVVLGFIYHPSPNHSLLLCPPIILFVVAFATSNAHDKYYYAGSEWIPKNIFEKRGCEFILKRWFVAMLRAITVCVVFSLLWLFLNMTPLMKLYPRTSIALGAIVVLAFEVVVLGLAGYDRWGHSTPLLEGMFPVIISSVIGLVFLLASLVNGFMSNQPCESFRGCVLRQLFPY